MKKCTASIIRPKKQARKKVARRLVPKIKASNVGVAFLSAQITDLEERCEAMRNGINNERQEEPRGASAVRVSANTAPASSTRGSASTPGSGRFRIVLCEGCIKEILSTRE